MATTAPTKPFAWQRHGRAGWSYKIQGEKVQSVTKIINEGIPKPALMGWYARQAAETAVRLRDILPSLTNEEMTDLLKGAPNRTRDAAAGRGTEVHGLAEKLARGMEVEVPPELETYVTHYVDFLETWCLSEAILERPVFHEELKYGGRPDMMARSPRVGYALWDVKTSGSGVYGEVALQLTAYSRATTYIDEDGVPLPMPDFDAHMCVWVTEKGYDVFEVECGDMEWQAFRSAAVVAWWREHRMDRVIGDSMWQSRVVGE